MSVSVTYEAWLYYAFAVLHLVSVCQLFYGLPNSLHGVFGLSGIDPKLVKQIAGVDSGQSLTFALVTKIPPASAIKILEDTFDRRRLVLETPIHCFQPFLHHLNFGSVDARRRFDEIFRFDLVGEDCVILLAAHLAVGSYSRNAESTTVYDESLGVAGVGPFGLSERCAHSDLSLFPRCTPIVGGDNTGGQVVSPERVQKKSSHRRSGKIKSTGTLLHTMTIKTSHITVFFQTSKIPFTGYVGQPCSPKF